MDEAAIIGRNGALPWHLPADLRNFKKITMGKPIVMGRRTHESIGRPLPSRENIVITRTQNFSAPDCTVVHSLAAALELCAGVTEVMIIGGASIYAEALLLAQRIYLTQVHARVRGDVHFPPIDLNAWLETNRVDHAADEHNPHAYSFVVLERR